MPVKPVMSFAAIRSYSAPASLSKEEIEGRIIDLLNGFDKVSPDLHYPLEGGFFRGNDGRLTPESVVDYPGKTGIIHSSPLSGNSTIN